jgi:hypothetical protein
LSAVMILCLFTGPVATPDARQSPFSLFASQCQFFADVFAVPQDVKHISVTTRGQQVLGKALCAADRQCRRRRRSGQR